MIDFMEVLTDCIICQKPTTECTIWVTEGNYGSTIFDPMDNSFLAAKICDKCLKKRIGAARRYIPKTTTKYKELDIE